MKKFSGFLCSVLLIFGLAFPVHAIVIDFEGLPPGPSVFSSAGSAQVLSIPTTIGNVVFEGGVILTNTANLPANQTSIYGTASFAGPSYINPLTVTFPDPITNFFLDVYNGNTIDVTYRVEDDIGNFFEQTLVPNLSGGETQVAFAATGTEVTIEAITLGTSTAWDFFIDNITFNEPLPNNNAVPEPTTMLLLGSGLVSLVGMGRRRFFKKS